MIRATATWHLSATAGVAVLVRPPARQSAWRRLPGTSARRPAWRRSSSPSPRCGSRRGSARLAPQPGSARSAPRRGPGPRRGSRHGSARPAPRRNHIGWLGNVAEEHKHANESATAVWTSICAANEPASTGQRARTRGQGDPARATARPPRPVWLGAPTTTTSVGS